MPVPRMNLTPVGLLMGVRYGSRYHIHVACDFEAWKALQFSVVGLVCHPALVRCRR